MFFMVLDLRLVKDWLSGDNQFFYLYARHEHYLTGASPE
jgi:hypothetical protein